MRDLLLTLHIMSAAAWLGGNFTQLMLLPLMERAGRAATVTWFRATEQMAKIYYSIAGVALILTGILLLVAIDSPYSFSDPFVSIGFAVVIIGAIAGVAHFAPQARAAAAANEEGDAAAATAARNKIAGAAVVDTALVIFAIYAMVSKLGY